MFPPAYPKHRVVTYPKRVLTVVAAGVPHVDGSHRAAGFDALRLQPQGLNIAIVFAGFYCLLIGCLIFRSTFAMPKAEPKRLL
jgi:hypothetical protein